MQGNIEFGVCNGRRDDGLPDPAELQARARGRADHACPLRNHPSSGRLRRPRTRARMSGWSPPRAVSIQMDPFIRPWLQSRAIKMSSRQPMIPMTHTLLMVQLVGIRILAEQDLSLWAWDTPAMTTITRQICNRLLKYLTVSSRPTGRYLRRRTGCIRRPTLANPASGSMAAMHPRQGRVGQAACRASHRRHRGRSHLHSHLLQRQLSMRTVPMTAGKALHCLPGDRQMDQNLLRRLRDLMQHPPSKE